MSLETLLRDATRTWQGVAALGFVGAAGQVYPYRSFMPYRRDHDAYFEKVIAALENSDAVTETVAALIRHAGLSPKAMPTAAAARRLRVVTDEVPRLLAPVSRTGVGSDCQELWRLLWLDACGHVATKIGAGFKIKRNQVWRLRSAAYAALTQRIELMMASDIAA